MKELENLKTESLEIMAKSATESIRLLEFEGIIPKGEFPINSIVFMGKPGAGKGFQTTELENRRDILAHSSGEVLRSYRDCIIPEIQKDLCLYPLNEGQISREKVRTMMNNGKLIEDFDTLNIVFMDLLEQYKNGKISNSTLLAPDGYPRTMGQYTLIQPFINIVGAIELVATNETRFKRISGRKRVGEEDVQKIFDLRNIEYMVKTEPGYKIIRNQEGIPYQCVDVNTDGFSKDLLKTYDLMVDKIKNY